ncbi:hypothetical protein CVT25_002754 [Psilocybe cyanescens]|uniref:Uncharacterized protein n=1 Tax=Psilocybe cyanescens TaxID=93625 RepID=A0A409WL26_PSICY|nr:hypothetical protein CVT25_002754 [Psilocybe cyanescens]
MATTNNLSHNGGTEVLSSSGRQRFWSTSVEFAHKHGPKTYLALAKLHTCGFTSFGFFQIAGVNNNMYARTAVMCTIISSGLGTAVSASYICLQSSFLGPRFAQGWLEASNCRNSRQSFNFFMFLTLPFSLLAWSISFGVLTLFITIFTDPNHTYTASQTTSIITAVFLFALVVFHTVPVISAAKQFNHMTCTSFGFFQIAGVTNSGHVHHYIIGPGFAQGWLEASNCRNSRQSFDFFMLLALPFSLLAWSISFGVLTLFITIFTDPNQTYTTSQTKTIVTAIFLIVLVIFHTIPVIGAAMQINCITW